jgi:hypothetical protein
MANSDKNIVITPNIGSTTADPTIVFSGANSSTGPQNITLKAYPTNNGTLSIDGSAGQLFSVTNSMSGTIFSVNDVSGIPSIEVIDTGDVRIARYSGNLLVGTTSHTDGSMFQSSATALNCYRTSSFAANGVFGVYSNVGGTKTVRAYFQTDGGLANFSANNVNLSDKRLKKDIAPAGNYLAKICAIPVKTFRYKDQFDTEDLTLGVIAQEVQQIAPELVSGNGFGLDDEDRQDYLSIYQTDLQYALMKCIQEQQALIQTLTARVAALESK